MSWLLYRNLLTRKMNLLSLIQQDIITFFVLYDLITCCFAVNRIENTETQKEWPTRIISYINRIMYATAAATTAAA